MAAFRVLASDPDPAMIGALIHEARNGSPDAADALAAQGEPATRALLRSLAKARPAPLVEVLGRLGTDSTDQLLAALVHPNAQVRTLSAMALGQSVDPRAPFELLDRIDDPADPIWIA